MSTYNEADHPRGEGGRYTDKIKTGKPDELPTDSGDIFTTTYDTAEDALAAALREQEFYDTYILTHKTDGYHVAQDDNFYSEGMTAIANMEPDTNVIDPDSILFIDGHEPDEYSLEHGQADGWQYRLSRLEPVEQWMNGDADSIRIYNVQPLIPDDDDEYSTDHDYFLVCAEYVDKTPQNVRLSGDLNHQISQLSDQYDGDTAETALHVDNALTTLTTSNDPTTESTAMAWVAVGLDREPRQTATQIMHTMSGTTTSNPLDIDQTVHDTLQSKPQHDMHQVLSAISDNCDDTNGAAWLADSLRMVNTYQNGAHENAKTRASTLLNGLNMTNAAEPKQLAHRIAVCVHEHEEA